MFRSSRSQRPGKPQPGIAFLLGALASALLVMAGLGCGQDVLVARWTLLSETPDAGAANLERADAGLNPQSDYADRARRRAHREATQNSHDDRSEDKSR